MKQSIAIALSGGVDSLVSAYLLKKQGHNVIGIHFLTGYGKDTSKDQDLSYSNPDLQKIYNIAEQLDIQVKIIDISADFDSKVIKYFTTTYLSGKTPNPCLICNQLIKFGLVLSFAKTLGTSYLATGHYARIKKDNTGKVHLLTGIDIKKDQSYFLSFLKQNQLLRACFPLGNMTKKEVVEFAKDKGLVPLSQKESQDICFIQGDNYKNFLAKQHGFFSKPGIIEDVKGKVLGSHNGLHLFTIGQRKGINCPASEPYYVAGMNTKQNRLIVGFKKDLMSSKCSVININWINEKVDLPITVATRIRYRHKAVPALVTPVDKNTAAINFFTPQKAVTPGQAAVFYNGEEVIGAGWIETVNNEKK